jgi:hypothetical protein
MEKTQLRDFSSFLLGSFGSATEDSFYRSESSEQHPSSVNRTSILFNLSQNQRKVIFTRYSVLDVLQTAPLLIFTFFRFMSVVSSNFSDFSFKLSIINDMYLTKKQNYGRVSLTSC